MRLVGTSRKYIYYICDTFALVAFEVTLELFGALGFFNTIFKMPHLLHLGLFLAIRFTAILFDSPYKVVLEVLGKKIKRKKLAKVEI